MNTTLLPLDPFRIAEEFLKRHPANHLRHHRGGWWRWDGRKYVELGEGDLRAYLALLAKELAEAGVGPLRYGPPPLVTRSVVTSALQALTALTLVPEDLEVPSWLSGGRQEPMIAVENGLLSVDKLLRGEAESLEPHAPEWFSTVALPYAYASSATAPRFLAFLQEIFAGDAALIGLVQEWFGYCLTPDTTQQRFLILTGEGANGKSVLLELLMRLLGEENVSHVPMELFHQRFQLIETVGKLANIATEIGEIDRVAEGILKAFTSADRMQFEAKGKQPISARPTARLVFATNNLPRFADRSSGVWRRMLLIPFEVVIPPERQDPELAEKLAAELPGILNWALEGLKCLRRQGRFSAAGAAEDAKAEYRLESNPARAFLEEAVSESSGAVLSCQTLYDVYRRWLDARGLQPLTAPQFGREVCKAFPAVKRVKVGGRGEQVGVYRGIEVTSSPLPEPW